MAKETKQDAVTVELSPAGVAFLQVCVAAVGSGRFTPQGTPEALQIWLDGYQEIRAQLPEPKTKPA